MELEKKIEEQIKRLIGSYTPDTVLTDIIEELKGLQIEASQIKIHPIGVAHNLCRKDIRGIDFVYSAGVLRGLTFMVKTKEILNTLIQSFSFDTPLLKIISEFKKFGIPKKKINIIPGGALSKFTKSDLISITEDDFLFDENGDFWQLKLRLRTENWIKELVDSYPLDISAEVIVAELIEHGLDISKIDIQTQGIFERFYKKDVANVDFTFDDNGELTHIYLKVNREGIYDSLPEVLFHQPAERVAYKSKDGMLKDSVRLDKEEMATRLFFKPIESAIYKQRVMLELKERETIRNFSSKEIIKFWDLPIFLSKKQVATLLFLLPITTKIVGKTNLVTGCLEAILEEKVNIRTNYDFKPKEEEKDTSNIALLGETSLGVDTITNGVFNDGIPTVTLEVGPVLPNKITSFMPEGTRDVLVNWLIEYFFPAEWEVDVEILIDEETYRPCILGEQQLGLGYSFVI